MPLQQAISVMTRKGWIRFRGYLDSYFSYLTLWRFGAQIGAHLCVNGKLRCFNYGIIIIGNDVRINSGPDNNYVGGDRRTNFWVWPGAKLCIEDQVAISNSTIIARSSVIIKQGTFIGGGCDIYDNDFHEIAADDRNSYSGNVGKAHVQVGPHAFIGGHSIILKGVNIGRGAVIGAGSLVTTDVPPNQVWGGRPARFIKEL